MQILGVTGRLPHGLVATAVIGLTVLGASSRAVTARDDDGSRHRECSNATLEGDYGFLTSGFKPVPPPVGGLERFNAVGIYAFDGQGGFTFAGGVLQGEVTGTNPDPTNVVGTYEILPNCTGSISWQPNPPLPLFIRFSIVVVDKGRQVKLAGTTGISQGEAIRK